MPTAAAQYHRKIIEQRGGGLIEFRGGATKLRFGRRNFVAKLPRNSLRTAKAINEFEVKYPSHNVRRGDPGL